MTTRCTFHERGQLLVLITNPDPFTDEWWRSSCESIHAAAERGPIRFFVDAREGNMRPTGPQRSLLRKAAAPDNVRAAIVTDTWLVRGVVTALRKYGYQGVKAFKSRTLEAALDHLEVTPEEREWVLGLCAPI